MQPLASGIADMKASAFGFCTSRYTSDVPYPQPLAVAHPQAGAALGSTTRVADEGLAAKVPPATRPNTRVTMIVASDAAPSSRRGTDCRLGAGVSGTQRVPSQKVMGSSFRQPG